MSWWRSVPAEGSNEKTVLSVCKERQRSRTRSLIISTNSILNSHVAIYESSHNNRYMQTAVQTVLSEPAPVCQCYKASHQSFWPTHDKLFTICTSTRSRLPTHMLFFILRGSFSEPSPAQGTPVLLLPVHQHNACPQSSFTLLLFRFVLFFISQSFDKTRSIWNRCGRLSWCENIYL